MVAFGSNVIEILIKATDGASAQIDAVKGKMAGLGSAVQKLRGPLLALGAASVGIAALSVKSFADFETSMAKVNTLLDEGEDSTELYGDAVARLAEEYGVAGGRIGVAAGLYQTISAGITDTAEATMFLEAASKAAVGGSAELQTVILAGTKTMAAFGIEAEDTEMVMDKFAGAVVAGQTTMSELASAFPRVSGMAGEMGATLDETLGVLAGLTKVLGSTDEAATGMSAVFTGLLKPTDTMKETLADMGFESGQAAIKSLGLMGTLQALKEVTGDDAEAMGELFGNVRALRAIFPALGKAADDVASSIDIVSNSAGLSTKQFEDMDETAGQRMAKLQAKFEGMTIKIGEALMPLIEKIVPFVEKLIEIFTGLGPAIQVGIIVIGALGGVIALLAPTISAIVGLIGGAGGLGAVIGVLTGPIGWVILAVGLLAAAWATNFGGIRDIVEEVIGKVAPLLEKVMSLFGKVADILWGIFEPAFSVVFGLISDVVNGIWTNVFSPVFGFIIEYLTLVIDAFDALLSALDGDASKLKDVNERIKEFFLGTFNAIIDAALGFGKFLVDSMVSGLMGLGGTVANALWNLIPFPFKQILEGTFDIGKNIARSLSGGGFDLSEFIPRFGNGGIAMSPMLAIVGDKGPEAIIPLNQMGTGGSTNIYIQNVNLASDYDVDDFKRRMAEDEKDAWANKQNK